MIQPVDLSNPTSQWAAYFIRMAVPQIDFKDVSLEVTKLSKIKIICNILETTVLSAGANKKIRYWRAIVHWHVRLPEGMRKTGITPEAMQRFLNRSVWGSCQMQKSWQINVPVLAESVELVNSGAHLGLKVDMYIHSWHSVYIYIYLYALCTHNSRSYIISYHNFWILSP